MRRQIRRVRIRVQNAAEPAIADASLGWYGARYSDIGLGTDCRTDRGPSPCGRHRAYQEAFRSSTRRRESPARTWCRRRRRTRTRSPETALVHQPLRSSSTSHTKLDRVPSTTSHSASNVARKKATDGWRYRAIAGAGITLSRNSRIPTTGNDRQSFTASARMRCRFIESPSGQNSSPRPRHAAWERHLPSSSPVAMRAPQTVDWMHPPTRR